jgi:hypothetical protein
MLHAVFDPVSNREDWVNTSEVRDQDNNLVDLTTATIVVELRDKNAKRVLLSAKTADNTITIPSTGFFAWTFGVSQMRSLDASVAYEIGCTIQLNGITHQYFRGSVPVLDGIVQ